MKPVEWKTYRTRFLIKAKQLSSSLSFVDHLGRQHCGRKGDYLVESSDGVLSIAPRRIFEDIYVPMSESTSQPISQSTSPSTSLSNQSSYNEPTLNRLNFEMNFEPLEIEEVKLAKPPRSSQRRQHELILQPDDSRPGSVSDEPARVRRKLPQPCRVRPSSSGFRLM